MKAKTPLPKAPSVAPVPQKSFLRRIGVIVAVVAMLAILIVTAIFVFNRAIPEKPITPPLPPAAVPQLKNLPGPKGQLSERSKDQLRVAAEENPRIMAIVALRYKYGKTESRYIFSWTHPKAKVIVDKIIADNNALQASGKGMSSEEAAALAAAKAKIDPAVAARALRNSEEAKQGLVKCVPITEATLMNPELVTIATGICYATIPPFDPNTTMAIIVLTDNDLENFSEVSLMRRQLLMLQIDIFNRDFQGRETWIHP